MACGGAASWSGLFFYPRAHWQSRVHSPCPTGGTAGNGIRHARKFLEVPYFVFKKIMQMFAFCFIQSGLQEAGPYLFPVAFGVPCIPQGHPYSNLGRGLPRVDIPFKHHRSKVFEGAVFAEIIPFCAMCTMAPLVLRIY